MFSQLSRGYGSWTAGYVDPYYRENKDREPTFPEIDQESHCHGVTVGSRSGRSTSMSWTTKKSREPSSDSITIPKTFTTRRGALQLFVAPDDLEDDEEDEGDYDGYALKPKYVEIRRPMGQELIDLSLKLGTLERLAASVLQFGDKEFDHENSSITDEKNKAFLKFLHSIDGQGRWSEASLKPGGDLNTYLRDLKSSASSRHDGGPNISKSRASLELQAILRGLDTPGWPMSFSQDGFSDRQSNGQFTRPASRVSSTGTSPGPPSTPKSSYQVLSSRKLAASIKSGTYLGRPASKLSVNDDEDSENGGPSHVRSASVNRKRWSPNESTDDELLNVRNDMYWGSVTSGSIAEEDQDLDELKKRRRFKEKSLLTQSETLYQVDEVLDEDISELRSHRSSRKGHSKISTGSLEDGEGQDDTSSILTSRDALNVAAELDALGLRQPVKKQKKGKKEKTGDGSLTYPLLPPGKRPKAPPEKTKIPDHLQDALKRRPSMSYESMERDLERRGFLSNGQVTDMVGESLAGPTLEAVGEGLTEEELELAKMILQKKIDEARNKIEGKEIPTGGKKKPAAKAQKKGGKKKKGSGEDTRTEEEKERDAIRQKHEEAKKKRDEEAAELQRKIAERRALLQAQDDQTSAKSKEIREKMEQLEKEAEDLQRAEDEARDILADVRKKQREEREARRKADLERKRQEASDRRDREKKEQEEKRKKELEMMEKIADAEMRRRMREEEERRAYEEERLAQERYEEEMREAARMEEEAEERMKEMERQAEEEAMQRLIEEREAAERNRRRLMQEEEAMREAEMLKREMMEIEAKRLEEEQRKILDAEEARRELERQRLMELRRMEEEARLKMQEELESKRQEAVARRDFNLESRMHVDKLRHYQGITRAWTFSYFVRWPRDTYERPMGSYDARKVKIKNPAPKKVVEPVPEEGAPAPAVP